MENIPRTFPIYNMEDPTGFFHVHFYILVLAGGRKAGGGAEAPQLNKLQSGTRTNTHKHEQRFSLETMFQE